MKPSLLAACGLFLFGAGIGIGWLASSSANGKTPSAAAEQANPARNPSRPRPVANDGQVSRLRGLADDPKRLDAEMDGLSGKDLPTLVEMLAASASVEGLGWEERGRIKNLVARHYGESPEETLAWVMATSNPGNRRFYFQSVFECAAEKNPMDALGIAEKCRAATGDYLSLPLGFLRSMIQDDPDSLVRAMALTVGKMDNSSGWGIDYPKDFNFKAAAKGISDLSSGMKENERFSTFPSDFVEAWVKQDAQAAYEWASAADGDAAAQRTNLGGLSDFFDGYLKVAEPVEYGHFAAETTLSGEPTDKSWWNATSALVKNPEPAVVDAFLAEASTHRNSAEILTKLLDTSQNFYSSQVDILRKRLFDRLPEAQRAQYLLTAPEVVRRQLGAEPAK